MNIFGVVVLLVAVALGAVIGLAGFAASPEQSRMAWRYYVGAAVAAFAFGFLLLRLFD